MWLAIISKLVPRLLPDLLNRCYCAVTIITTITYITINATITIITIITIIAMIVIMALSSHSLCILLCYVKADSYIAGRLRS